MPKVPIYVAVVLLALGLTTSPSSAVSLQELVGKWVSLNTNEVITFSADGDVMDYRLGQGRFTKNALSYGANMAVVYQENKWCWYYATVTKNGALVLARRNPKQDAWLCTTGSFVLAK